MAEALGGLLNAARLNRRGRLRGRWLDGEDLRGLPLLERKRRLLDILPTVESRVRYVDHVHETGVRFFELACQRDLEGVVGKYGNGRYQSDGAATSWVKFKNSAYSQAVGRADVGTAPLA